MRGATHDDGTIDVGERIGVDAVEDDDGGASRRRELADHRLDHGIAVWPDDGDGLARGQSDPQGHVVAGETLDHGSDRVAPRCGVEHAAVPVEHARCHDERCHADLDRADGATRLVSAPERGRHSHEVAFETREFDVRRVDWRVNGTGTRSGADEFGDELDPAAAEFDDGAGPQVGPADDR